MLHHAGATLYEVSMQRLRRAVVAAGVIAQLTNEAAAQDGSPAWLRDFFQIPVEVRARVCVSACADICHCFGAHVAAAAPL